MHRNWPTAVLAPYGSVLATGSMTVSPAQTSLPEPLAPTSSPCPKSTTFGQLFGRGGGDHERCRMSHRAKPPMIMQPMFPEGERKVARWRTGPDVELVLDVETPVDVDVEEVVVDVVGLPVELATTGTVVVAVTVLVELEPHAPKVRPASTAIASHRLIVRHTR